MSTRLDDANRSFAWLLALALAPYALAAMAGCLLFTVVLGRLGDGGVGALAAGPGDLRPAVAFLLMLAAATTVAGLSLRTQLRATRRLAARVAGLSTPLPDKVAAAAAHARLAGRVDVVDTPEPLSFAYGLRAPRVAVSVGLLDQVSADELAAVLAHERYHVTNLDPAKVVIARALSAGLFFLPALRGLLRRYRAERELAADRTAIRAHGPTALAGALYRVAAGPAWPELATAAALGGPDLLEARVGQLETGREPPATPIPSAALAATVVALALLVAALVVPLASLGGPDAVMRDMMADQTMSSAGLAGGIWWCALPLVAAAAVAIRRHHHPADHLKGHTMNLRACLNPKVLTALGAVTVGLALFAPRLTAALPILAALACPLSMLAMGWVMRRRHTSADTDPADPVGELVPSGDQLAASPEARA